MKWNASFLQFRRCEFSLQFRHFEFSSKQDRYSYSPFRPRPGHDGKMLTGEVGRKPVKARV